MAIRKDGSQLNPADERNTGTRQGEAADTNRINDEDELDTRNVAGNVEEGEEDYDDEELEEEDFEVDEEEDDEETEDEKEV
ncbi:MAG: hypothetical protein ACXWV9_00270 [Flavisolibacter sp.]